MIFLIEFEYETACTTVLVRDAVDFDDACRQIEKSFKSSKYFRDLTI